MKLSMILPSTPVELETSEGVVELNVTEFTVADGERREKLIRPIFNDENVSYIEKLNAFNIARIMCALKDTDGNYYFHGDDITWVRGKLGKNLADALAQLVDELNPLPVPPSSDDEKESALDAKKN